MRWWLWGALIGLIIGHAGLAMADGHGDALNCVAAYFNKDYDTALALCTRAVQSGDLSNEQAAHALNDRGAVYSDGEGDYDKAIQDYDQAIRLLPDYEGAYNNRGNAYARKGDYDRAMQDFNQAIRLNPDHDSPYLGRAGVYDDQGEHDRAMQDLDHAIRLHPNAPFPSLWRAQVLFELARFSDAVGALQVLVDADPTFADGVLWLTLAQRRAGYSADAGLKVHAQALDLEKWPGPVVRFYLGQITRDALEEIVGDPNPNTAKRQSCEATFYIAELDLVSKQVEAAKPGFQHVIDSCPKVSAVARAAKAELSRM
jgi:lipoprotein NlpI